MADPAVDLPPLNGALPPAPAEPASVPLTPLAVSGLVVTKADLIRALQVYVPLLTDLSPLDGDRYLLHLPATNENEQ